jgi:N utilization substance protein B
MGIAEFLFFPSIPVRVTINEYLEISKEYSTPKSSIFINGILDKLVKEYTEAGTLNKIGRGLR